MRGRLGAISLRIGQPMSENPAILRRDTGDPAALASSLDEGDPILASGARKRIAALAALLAAAYSVVVPLDLAIHAMFNPAGLTSPARLKNVAMALVAWWVYLAARRSTLSLKSLTRLAYLMVFLLGLHQTLEALHFFQWPASWPASFELLPEGEQRSLVDGVPWTCLALVLFPPFVPGSPRKHFLLALALALPLLGLSAGWATLEERSLWEVLSPEAFASLPICVVLSLFMSLAFHRIDTALRTERRRSRDLGSYELLRQLGSGGMGEVWLVRHKMLARPAALKLIHSQRVSGPDERSADVLRRFEREARATARLRSAHTVELYDFGRTEAGDFYYVMELLDGMDLEALVRSDGRQPARRVIGILRQACLSLAEAHDQGLIHRDIKPANIFLCRQGTEVDVVKVLDFGLVAHVDRFGSEDHSALTGDNDVLGTPAFMAPEMVVAPDEVDHRADLYGLGCVGYWLLAGQRLFPEKTPVTQLFAHVHKELPSPLFPGREPPVPLELESLLARTLAKDPADRPDTARELLKALERIDDGDDWGEAEQERWWRELAPQIPGTSTFSA
jgi:serine/threonine-protein kinase